MCCLCIQFTHENTSERTILHLVKTNSGTPDPPFQVWLLALQKRLATPLVIVKFYYCACVYIIHFYGSGFTTLIRFNYWILCETVLPGQGGVPRLAEVDFTDTDASRHRI